MKPDFGFESNEDREEKTIKTIHNVPSLFFLRVIDMIWYVQGTYSGETRIGDE